MRDFTWVVWLALWIATIGSYARWKELFITSCMVVLSFSFLFTGLWLASIG
jgi:hypothetical protein